MIVDHWVYIDILHDLGRSTESAVLPRGALNLSGSPSNRFRLESMMNLPLKSRKVPKHRVLSPNLVAQLVLVVSTSLLSDGLACQVLSTPEHSSDVQRRKRGTLVGKVLRFDGTASVNTTVTIVRIDAITKWKSHILEFIRVRTDDKGKFRAELLLGRPYHAWALLEEEDSRYRSTRICEFSFAGRPIVLREYEKRRRRMRLRLNGRKAWQNRGPLRCVVQTFSVGVQWQVSEPDEEGTIVVPALPGSVAWIRVFSHDGQQLLGFDQLFHSLDEYDGKVLDLHLGDPYPVAIRVRADAIDGPPIPGARIFSVGVDGSRSQVAMTDKEGIAYFFAPVFESKPLGLSLNLDYVAVAKGRGEVKGGLNLREYDKALTMRGLRASGRVDDEVVMMKGHALSGRLWLSQGRPARKVTVRLDVAIPTRSDHIGRGRPILTRTDEEGRFSFESRNHGFAYRLSCYVEPSLLSPRQAEEGYPLQGLVVLAQDVTGSSKDLQLDDFHLDRMRALRVDVSNADGHHTESPALFFTDAESVASKKGVVPGGILYIGNARGRLAILLPNKFNRGLLVAVSAVSQGSARVLDTFSEAPCLRIRLRPSTTIHGRVVGDDGNPLADVRLMCSPVSKQGDLSQFIHPWFFDLTTSKADGSFEVRVRTGRTYTLIASLGTHDDPFGVVAAEQVEVAGKPVKNVTLTLRR